MGFLSITARDDVPLMADGQALAPALERALANCPADAPVVILLHGFRYAPGTAAHSPHTKILSPVANGHQGRGTSWPAALGLAKGSALGIGFGWDARGSFWHAYGRAAMAGRALSRLITEVRVRHDGPVRILAHSLGAQVAMNCLPDLPAGAVERTVLLAAAAFRPESAQAAASPAGRAGEIINVTSKQNQLFDFLLERLMGRAPGSALGQGLTECSGSNWLDLGLDDPEVLRGLAAIGHPLAPPARQMCHWSLYLRAGMFDLYRAMLLAPQPLDLPQLRLLAPLHPAPSKAAHPLLSGLAA